MDDFKPDVVHLNNIQFYLTPSIILETQKYRKETKRSVKLIYTAHDYQLICPSHGLFDSDINICEECLDGNYFHCLKKKCMKNSRMKSMLATADAYFWKFSKAYKYIDKIICPSVFLKQKLDTQSRFSDKTVVLHNFIEQKPIEKTKKEDYVLEFGHLSADKGTNTLLKVAKRLPTVRFLFAGYGESQKDISLVSNAEYVGFKTGTQLQELISKAKCSVYPSEWYENCPFSVIESQMLMTPVIASRTGGIPELIKDGKTGLLFTPGDADDLEKKLRFFLETPGIAEKYTEECKNISFESPESYYDKLAVIYGER